MERGGGGRAADSWRCAPDHALTNGLRECVGSVGRRGREGGGGVAPQRRRRRHVPEALPSDAGRPRRSLESDRRAAERGGGGGDAARGPRAVHRHRPLRGLRAGHRLQRADQLPATARDRAAAPGAGAAHGHLAHGAGRGRGLGLRDGVHGAAAGRAPAWGGGGRGAHPRDCGAGRGQHPTRPARPPQHRPSAHRGGRRPLGLPWRGAVRRHPRGRRGGQRARGADVAAGAGRVHGGAGGRRRQHAAPERGAPGRGRARAALAQGGRVVRAADGPGRAVGGERHGPAPRHAPSAPLAPHRHRRHRGGRGRAGGARGGGQPAPLRARPMTVRPPSPPGGPGLLLSTRT